MQKFDKQKSYKYLICLIVLGAMWNIQTVILSSELSSNNINHV